MSWFVELLKTVGVALGVLAPVVKEAISSTKPPPAPTTPPASFADVDKEVDEEVESRRAKPGG